MGSILEKLKKLPDSSIPGDDHPFRKNPLSDEEVEQAIEEIAQKYKDAKPANPDFKKIVKEMNEAIIKALNSTDNPY